MSKLTTTKFRFRKHDSIGAADAKYDEHILSTCFIDNGDLKVLGDCHDPRRILLGRTGSGKTALLSKLASQCDHIVEISPEQLSFSYLSNSLILKYLTEIGVNLDLFYKLLWQHIFAVELIKKRHRIQNESQKNTFLGQLWDRISGNSRKTEAINYLNQWGEKFWEPTESRMKEITKKFESDICSKVGIDTEMISAYMQGGMKKSEEEKTEIRIRAQSVVNQVQIQQLFDLIEVLRDDVFNDPQFRVYICVDRLDERWVENQLRYRLIRSLIEALMDFYKVKNSKIIIALRQDLIDRVIRDTRDEGFQEEKYKSLYLPVKWSKEDLLNMLDQRINWLVRQQYTNQQVTFRDLLPDKIDGESVDEFLVNRTLLRPRDLILFLNRCIEKAAGKATISLSVVKEAEADYSTERLRSLADEWHSIYPDLIEFVFILKKKTCTFKIGSISEKEFQDYCLDIAVRTDIQKGPLVEKAHFVSDATITTNDFRNFLFLVFYRVGIVGLKHMSYTGTMWSFKGGENFPSAAIDDHCIVSVHPMLWRVLGTTPDE